MGKIEAKTAKQKKDGTFTETIVFCFLTKGFQQSRTSTTAETLKN
jgi:hypothetical protein